MQIVTLTYTRAAGWSAPIPAALDSPHTLVLAFGASDLFDHHEPFRALADAFPASIVTGCSTSGTVLGAKVVDHLLAVAVVRFDRVALRAVLLPVTVTSASHDVGSSLGQQLQAPDLRGVLVLSDGVIVNGSDLAAGLNAVLPSSVVVTGGLAGDDDRFMRTWILHNGRPEVERVTALGFYGDHVQFQAGSKGGWDIFGRERTVTKSDGNILLELDGQPALDLYKKYLGDFASGLPATGLLFPLAILRDMDDQDPIVRTLLGIDEEARSLRFAGNVPQGAMVRLMHTNLDRLIDGATDAAEQARGPHGEDAPVLSVAISCAGRRWVLGDRTDEELENVLAELPSNTTQLGFYSYGELSPRRQGPCDLHNQTMTLTTISER